MLVASRGPGRSAEDLPPGLKLSGKFAEKEAEFRKARENYTYRQSVKMEELDARGNVEGKWEIVSDIVFGPNKQRTEKVVYAPVNTLAPDSVSAGRAGLCAASSRSC